MSRVTRQNPRVTTRDVLPTLSADDAATRAALKAASAVAVKSGDPWWDTVFASVSDTPTITMATSSQISGGTSVAPTASYFADPYFRYDGCSAVQASSPGVTIVTAPELVIPETITDAADIEFVFRVGRTGTGVVGVRLVVDGKLSSLAMLRTFTTTSGTVYYYKCHFGSAKVRHLKFEIDGANRFDGVVVGTHAVLQRPVGPHKMRHTAIGDSLTIGGADYHIGSEVSGDYMYFRYESHAYYQSVLMGCDSFVSLGAGGTGWSDVYPSDPFSNRIALALASYPHILGFYGSRNDSGKESQIVAAVQAGLARVDNVPVVLVCGPQQAGYSTLNDLVRQGVVAAGRKWLNVDGVAASPASNATGHPTLAEQQAIAKAAHAQLDMTKLIGVVEGARAARTQVGVVVTTSPVTSAHSGASVTITATVTSAPVAAGTIQFYDNGSALGSPVTVTAGTAAYTTSALSTATHSITAKFTPTNPALFKSATSDAVSLVVDANLGMVDTFNRADSASLGNTDNGKAWNVGSYTGWAIAGNALANTTAAITVFAWVDCGAVLGTYKWTMAGTYSATVRLCLFSKNSFDANNYVFLNCGGGSNNWRLYARVGGTTNTVGTGSSAASWAAGDVMSVEVTQGSSSTKFNFVVKKNGTAITGLTVSDYDIGSTLAAQTCIAASLDASSTAATFDKIEMIPA